MIFTVLLAVHVLLALLLIGVILLQQGKGATAGAAFGSGASSTVFGARGSASFLTRLTAVLALLFFSNSLLLAYLYGQTSKPTSLLDQVQVPAPGAPAPAQSPPTQIDVGKLVDEVTKGKVLDVPLPTDVPVPNSSAPAAAPPVPARGATIAPAVDVPGNSSAPAADAPLTTRVPATTK